jgi:hypothetical protein
LLLQEVKSKPFYTKHYRATNLVKYSTSILLHYQLIHRLIKHVTAPSKYSCPDPTHSQLNLHPSIMPIFHISAIVDYPKTIVIQFRISLDNIFPPTRIQRLSNNTTTQITTIILVRVKYDCCDTENFTPKVIGTGIEVPSKLDSRHLTFSIPIPPKRLGLASYLNSLHGISSHHLYLPK